MNTVAMQSKNWDKWLAGVPSAQIAVNITWLRELIFSREHYYYYPEVIRRKDNYLYYYWQLDGFPRWGNTNQGD